MEYSNWIVDISWQDTGPVSGQPGLRECSLGQRDSHGLGSGERSEGSALMVCYDDIVDRTDLSSEGVPLGVEVGESVVAGTIPEVADWGLVEEATFDSWSALLSRRLTQCTYQQFVAH